MLLNFLCLLLHSLLETLIFAMQHKNLLLKFVICLQLRSKLFRAYLCDTVQVSLHSDEPLMVLFKGLFGFVERFDLFLVFLADF